MATQRYTQQRLLRQISAKCRSKVLQNARVERIAECSLGAFCNTFDLQYAIIGLDKTNNFLPFVEWPLKAGFTVYNKN